ncbi:hypothetical protein Tco_1522870 [Tanacetum coccineum]
MFHVSNLKKYLSDETLVIPLEELRVDDKLHFMKEPIEVMDREIKQLKRSRIPIIKVRWNFKRGPEFTWEREDQFKQKFAMSLDNASSAATYTFVSSDLNRPSSWGIPLVNAAYADDASPTAELPGYIADSDSMEEDDDEDPEEDPSEKHDPEDDDDDDDTNDKDEELLRRMRRMST